MATCWRCALFSFAIWFICGTIGDVNIRQDGSPWMCNNNPYGRQEITPLSEYDQKLINKLEQLQVVHRHGSRVGSDTIQSYLPDKGLKYDCNITSVVTRQYMDNDYYTNSSKKFYNLRKQYVANEQVLEGNCQYRQALKYLIPQQKANAHHIIDAYIGNEPYHLFNQSTLNSIADNLINYSEDERLTLTTTDYERTIASLVVIASELFADTFNNNEDNVNIIMNAKVHDIDSDPYHPNYISECVEQDEFIKWDALFDDDELLQNTEAERIVQSDFGNATITAYEAEGGRWKSNKVGTLLLYPYCAEMTLPLSNETFWDAVELSYEWGTTFVNTSYAMNKTECYNNFMNIPMLYKMKSDIEMLKNESKPRLVIHSAHDSTVIRLLQSLGMYDYELIIFGELVTLEIYSAKDDDDLYYFRFTRKGEFIEYPYCDYENGTELCDLEVMLENSFANVVSQKEWSSELCANVLSDCRCGYCEEVDISTTSDTDGCNEGNESDTFDAGSLSFIVGIVIGIGIGVVAALIVGLTLYKFCQSGNREAHGGYLLKDDTL